MDNKPVQLISMSGERFVVNEDAIKDLGHERRKVTVVSMVGRSRIGKTSLLNRMFGKASGFHVGSTIEAKTKGIWMWRGDFPGDKKRYWF
jgi:GTP-binding protein EngB required for normal cell division